MITVSCEKSVLNSYWHCMCQLHSKMVFLCCLLSGVVSFYLSLFKEVTFCLQCFDAVGWAAGRASGL